MNVKNLHKSRLERYGPMVRTSLSGECPILEGVDNAEKLIRLASTLHKQVVAFRFSDFAQLGKAYIAGSIQVTVNKTVTEVNGIEIGRIQEVVSIQAGAALRRLVRVNEALKSVVLVGIDGELIYTYREFLRLLDALKQGEIRFNGYTISELEAVEQVTEIELMVDGEPIELSKLAAEYSILA